MGLADEKYLAFTTFKRNGEGKSTAIWIADLGDGTLGFTTDPTSWKAKRLRNDPRVEMTPSNARGVPKPGAATTTGTATVVEGAEYDRVKAAIKKKYGFQVTMIDLLSKVTRRGSGSAAIVVRPD